MPDVVDLIRAKRGGQALDDAAIGWLIDAYTKGAVADEQMSAMAMAIFFRGLSPAELRAWTDAMIASGQRLGTNRSSGGGDARGTGIRPSPNRAWPRAL